MTSETATCTRCGITRTVRYNHHNDLCASCRIFDTPNPCTRCGRGRRRDNQHPTLCGECSRQPEHVLELSGGQWVRDGLVMRWQPVDTPFPHDITAGQTAVCAPRAFLHQPSSERWEA